MGFSLGKFRALPAAMLAARPGWPYAEMLSRWDASRDKGNRITTRVPCGDYFHVRDDALRAHATQVDPDGPWFRAPLELQKKAWPTEDYELARSLVESTGNGMEDDLFAGARETVCA